MTKVRALWTNPATDDNFIHLDIKGSAVPLEGSSTDIIWIMICMMASAFFSASETALTSFGELRTLQLLEQKGRGRRILQLWRDVPNRMLTTILIGNNLVNILASAIATELSFTMVGDAVGEGSRLALALAVGLMTFLILVCGEIFPKTYAKHNAESFLRVGPVLVGFYYLLFPITTFFVFISKMLAKSVGANLTKEGPLISVEDIEHMVKVGAEAEALDQDEARYLSGILELGDVVVREIMTPRTDISALEIKSSIEEVLAVVRRDGLSRYPVYAGQIDTVVGVLFVKDLMNVLGAAPASEDFSLNSIARQPTFVPETRAVDDLLTDFKKKKTHMAIVVDEFGGTAGVVTLEDALEEIVGEIYDEHDAEEPPDVQKTEEGYYLIAGGATIRDVESELGIEFPDDGEYDTIAGYVVDSSGDMPETGFSASFAGFRFVVMEADARRVALVKAIPEAPENEDLEAEDNEAVKEAG